MGNLTEYHKKLTHRDKLEIIVAWELFYGIRHSVGVIPFLDKDKVEQALIKRMAEGPNFGKEGSALRKLGTLVCNIIDDNDIQEVTFADGIVRRLKVGTTTTITVERYDEEGRTVREDIVFKKP